jgi:hypothetical protein
MGSNGAFLTAEMQLDVFKTGYFWHMKGIHEIDCKVLRMSLAQDKHLRNSTSYILAINFLPLSNF